MTKLQQQIQQEIPDIAVMFDVPLAPLSYAKIGGPAEVLATATNPEQAAAVLQFCNKYHVAYTILGGASNVIIDDTGLSGIVLRYSDSTVALTQKNHNGAAQIYIASGAKTALAVSQTVALGYTGLEYFLGVPGTIGGAIYNNAHYLTDLIDKYISRVHALTQLGEEVWYSHSECAFGYEQSRFQASHELILGAEFHLQPGDAQESQRKIAHATKYRASTQPLGIPSSGCMFRNPPNSESLKQQFPQFADKAFIPAGFLIDQAGLKGMRVGGVSVSEKHAAWIINHGTGTSADVQQLVANIKQHIAEQFGVQLETEVFFLSGAQTS